MQERGCVPAFDPSNTVPDHSLLSWSIMGICESCTNGCDEIVNEKELNQVFKKYSKEYPDNFMQSKGAVDEINACIIRLENNQCDQNAVDNVYECMCETVKVEMRDKLDSKTITLHSG